VLLVPADLARLVRALHDVASTGGKSAAIKHARRKVSTVSRGAPEGDALSTNQSNARPH
jgi:hypothetical protein